MQTVLTLITFPVEVVLLHFNLLKFIIWAKPVNVFPVTSPAMVIAITKRTESSETKLEKWEQTLSRSQLTKFTWNIYVRTLVQGTVVLQFWSKQNGDQKAESFESNKAKFRQSRHGSFEWNMVFMEWKRYLSKFTDIWHFTICKIRRENCRDMLTIRNEYFSSSKFKLLMNMHEICAYICAVQYLLPLSDFF